MAKVEPDIQGKVFAARSTSAIGQPVALLVAGPLTDGFFIPLMEGESQLSDLFASIVGRGDHAGYAAFFVSIGIGTLLMAVLGWLYRPLRQLESTIPDALAENGTPSPVSSVDEAVLVDGLPGD